MARKRALVIGGSMSGAFSCADAGALRLGSGRLRAGTGRACRSWRWYCGAAVLDCTSPRAWTAYKRTGRVNRAQAGSQSRGPSHCEQPLPSSVHRLGAGLSANTRCARAIALSSRLRTRIVQRGCAWGYGLFYRPQENERQRANWSRSSSVDGATSVRARGGAVLCRLDRLARHLA